MDQFLMNGDPPSEDSTDVLLFVPFVCALVSGTILLIQYYLRDLDLRQTLSTGIVQKRTSTSALLPLAQSHKPTRSLSVWKILRLVICLLLLILAVVGTALSDPCPGKSKPNPGKLDLAVTGLKHGYKHPKHHRKHTTICLSKAQSAHLALTLFYTYVSLLALLAVTLTSDPSNTCNAHLTPLLLITLLVDLLTLLPAMHPVLAYTQTVLLVLTSLVIPWLIYRSATAIKYKNPPTTWPSTGRLVVQNLSARYNEREPPVLEDVSFRVDSGECIGILGKLGCCKDALPMALLGMIWTDGKVFFDGLSTHTLNPSTLPLYISLISGSEFSVNRRATVRQILDPQGAHDESTLNKAIETAAAALGGLKVKLSERAQGLGVRERWGLECARAVQRQSKLVIVDETMISTYFSPDSRFYAELRRILPTATILIVTNNLQNICSGVDRVLVFSLGRVSEFDSPGVLLQKPEGAFKQLVDDSEEDTRSLVYQTFRN